MRFPCRLTSSAALAASLLAATALADSSGLFWNKKFFLKAKLVAYEERMEEDNSFLKAFSSGGVSQCEDIGRGKYRCVFEPDADACPPGLKEEHRHGSTRCTKVLTERDLCPRGRVDASNVNAGCIYARCPRGHVDLGKNGLAQGCYRCEPGTSFDERSTVEHHREEEAEAGLGSQELEYVLCVTK